MGVRVPGGRTLTNPVIFSTNSLRTRSAMANIAPCRVEHDLQQPSRSRKIDEDDAAMVAGGDEPNRHSDNLSRSVS